MSEKHTIGSSCAGKAHIVLEHVDFETTTDALLTKTLIRQHYRNVGDAAAEAEYSFPITWQAAVTRFAAQLGDEAFEAVAYASEEAEERYEDAVESGDTPILLNCFDAICRATIGNLLPGETLVLEIETAEAVRIVDGGFLLRLPTVIDFRYTSKSLTENFQVLPDIPVNLLADYPATAVFHLHGPAANCEIEHCSHDFRVERKEDGAEAQTLVRIAHAKLDRNITLRLGGLVLPERNGRSSFGRLARGADGYLYGLFSSIVPTSLTDSSECPASLDLRLVVDGSGSMAGAAIHNAREAVTGVVDILLETDAVAVLRFGSNVVPLASAESITRRFRRRFASEYAPSIQSNLGGTEMEEALKAALRAPAETSRRTAILLITDGKVWDSESIVHAVEKAGVPVFVIAVGHSPADETLEALASATGGLVEYATPGEPIDLLAARLVTSMRRRTARPLCPALTLLPPPDDRVEPTVSFKGISDCTVARWSPIRADDVERAALSGAPSDVLNGTMAPSPGQSNGNTVPAVDCEIEDDAVAKYAAYMVFRKFHGEEREDDALDVALQNGLLTPITSLLMVKVRDEAEKADGLPVFSKIPQMPAFAGKDLGGFACFTNAQMSPARDLGAPRFVLDPSDSSLSLEDWLADFLADIEVVLFRMQEEAHALGEEDRLKTTLEDWWRRLDRSVRAILEQGRHEAQDIAKRDGRRLSDTDWYLAVAARLLERLAPLDETFDEPELCDAIRLDVAFSDEQWAVVERCVDAALSE